MKKRQKRKTKRQTKLSILVHSNVVGVIIGQDGSTVREIMEQTSVRINVNKNDIVGYSEKAITIYGTPESCTNACRKILEVLQQKATDTSESNVILRILIYDNGIDLSIGEENNTIRNIMSETETKIVVFSNTDITVDNINYNSICTVEGLIENVSKAESQISAKLRQSFETYLRPLADYQRNVESAPEMRNFCEMGLPHLNYGGLGATPVIRNRQTESVLRILVHSNVVGVIIGRGGSTIREIMEQTSVRINVNKNDIVGYSEKAITIYGTPESCTNACRKILEVLQQKATDTSESNVILRILIYDNGIDLSIGEENNTIRNIMSETETKIVVFSNTDITVDNINYNSICTVEGLIENVSKAESQISAKLRQSFETYLRPLADYQRNVESAPEMRNFCEMGLPHLNYGGLGATPVIRNRQTESVLRILVHSNVVGVIIGRGGSTIREIMELTSARINVNKNDIVGYSKKAITIYGTPESCTNACRKILEVLQQKATDTSESNVILRILIYDNGIDLSIGEENNTIRNIMSETETKIVVFSNTDITVDNTNYNSICTVEGLIENVSKAESQISAKLRQSFETYLRPLADYQRNVESAPEMRNFCEMGLPHLNYGGLGATPVIRNRQTESVLRILVHSNVVGVIIGRGGSTIREIMELTSARINVNKNDIVGYSEKAITIYGTPESCTNACRKILEVLQQKATDTSESIVILRILIHDNLVGLIIGEEGNTIRNIMSETETIINVFGIIDITIGNINYKRVCKVEGSIENVSKAESQISAKLRQSFEKYLHQVAGCQINIEPATEMRNFCEMGPPPFLFGGSGATPIIRNRQTKSLLCILVHSDMVHAIIGNRGSTIKEITQQTNAWVHVQTKYNFGSMEQAIIVKGNPENCTHACLKILEALQQKAINFCSSSNNVVLKILIPDNIIGLIIEEEGNIIKKIMSETETKINVSSITDITIDSFNFKTICTIEGSVENTSKAESQISAKLRQSIEHFLQSVDDCQIKVEPALEMRNLCEVGHTHVSYVGQKTIPAIEIKEFTLRILVQSNMIPVIIGKHGSTIKEITQQTSAKVHVDQKYSVGSTETAITIKGIPENCTNACRQILDVIQRKSDVILKILVDNNQIGVIIREEGNIIKKIMSETDTNITVPSITDITIDSFNNERILTVRGSVENISKAEAQISSKLRQCIKNISHYKLTRLEKPEMTNTKYKLIIVGHSNVGKSSIVKRYCKDVYQFTKPTKGVDIQQIFVRFNNEIIHLEIWDTAGIEDYQCSENSYRGAHGVFIVYDITDFDSSFKLDGWIKDIKTLFDPNSVNILIGSKCDDSTNRKISIKEGHRIAEVYRIPFLEVSSKTNVNIDNLFHTMISRIYNLQNQPTDINKELMHTNDTMKQKKKLDSDVKPSTIPVQCLIVEKELPDIPNIQSKYNDREQYNLEKVKPETTNNCKLIIVQPDPNTTYKKYKLIIVGPSNVGKSTIIHRICKDEYKDSRRTTICIDFHEIFVRFENETIQLNIWDTAGTEKYRSLAHSYYRGAHGIFIVYDITNSNSSIELDCWLEDVKNFSDLNAVKILIGSKCDDTPNRKIPIEEGQEIAEMYGVPFFEVSSKTNVNIDKLFYTMILRIHDIKKELMHTNDTMKQKLDSDVKSSTIPVQCPKMEKEIPDAPNMEYDDSQQYNLKKVKPETTNKKLKLIIVGPSNVGKSAIIKYFCNGVFEDTVPTPDIDFEKMYIRFENITIRLDIWDTAGTEKYRSLTKSYYKGAHGIFIVYDITNVKSFVEVKDWINDVEISSDSGAVKILIGSKCDDKSNRKISINEGQEIAKNKRFPFFEVSPKTNVNMQKVLYTMILKILEHEAQLITVSQPNTSPIILVCYSPPQLKPKPSSTGCSC